MTTGVVGKHRRMRTRALIGIALATAGIASVLAVVAIAVTLSAAAGPSPTIAPSPATSPTAVVVADTDTSTASPSQSPSPMPATPTPSPTPTPTPDSSPEVSEGLVAAGTEPTVAADPFHSGVVAVISQNVFTAGPTSGCSRPSVRFSRDGGVTWGTPAFPWAYQCQDIHATIAWGPGSRLWAGDAVGVTGGVAMSVTYSDDFGKTWSGRFIQHFTKPWSGCYPSITVDNWTRSPNFGTVYVAYNWLPNSHGPGVALMASRSGTAWVHAEVPLGTPPAGYPYTWNMGYRIKAAPDGTAVVSFYQSSLRSWTEANMFSEGIGSNVGRRDFETALVHFDGKKLTADPPTPAVSVDHASAQWQSGLAVDDAGRTWLAVESGTGIRVGRLDTGGWQSFSVPGKDSFKPSLAASGQTIFVGWHAEDPDGRVWTYYSLSYDDGQTFLPPTLVTDFSWYPSSVASLVNGVGLRENADTADGVFFYVYGDARSGAGVYLARIEP